MRRRWFRCLAFAAVSLFLFSDHAAAETPVSGAGILTCETVTGKTDSSNPEGWLSVKPAAAETSASETVTGKTDSSNQAEWLSTKSVSDAYDTVVDEFDFSDLDEFLGENFTEEGFSFSELLSELIAGGGTEVLAKYARRAVSSALSDLKVQRSTLVKILFLGIAAALFAILADIFAGSQVADTGFFLTYMMLVTVLLGAFSVISQIGEEMIDAILGFMQVLLPTYFLAVGLSGGQTQAVAFYELTIAVIAFVEWIFQNFLLPAINLYLMIALVNALAEEDALSRFAGLLRTVIEWTSRILFGAAAGLNAIQGLVLSAADSQTVSAVQKLVGLIPGIGAGAQTVTELFLGAGRVIKNGIGGVALVLIVAIALFPLLKLCACYFMYLAMAALMQPISEPRFCGCLHSVAEGCGLVIRVLVSAVLLFMVTIAIICMSTG